MNQSSGTEAVLISTAESMDKRLLPLPAAAIPTPIPLHAPRESATMTAATICGRQVPPHYQASSSLQDRKGGGSVDSSGYDGGGGGHNRQQQQQPDGCVCRASENRNVENVDRRNNGDRVDESATTVAANRYGSSCNQSSYSASIVDHHQTNPSHMPQQQQQQQQQRYRNDDFGHRQWSSYRTNATANELRTPFRSTNANSKFHTSFSFRQTQVPDGYPKMDHERNPRRGSCVSEFSRKLAEGYDIWDDADRPIINWKYPQLPIRENKTHELRMMANLERIKKMREREKQMNKRNIRASTAVDKKETAWWERPKNGMRHTPAASAPSFASMTPKNSRNVYRSTSTNTNNNFNSRSNSVTTNKRIGSIYLSSSRR